jgi:hypothetical protein
MLRFLTFVFLAIFLLGSSLAAIDKKKSGKPNRAKTEAKIKTDMKDTLKSQDPARKVKPATADTKDYNSFIDKNNDGIDDRVEKKKKNVPPSLSIDKQKQTQKKATSDSKKESQKR